MALRFILTCATFGFATSELMFADENIVTGTAKQVVKIATNGNGTFEKSVKVSEYGLVVSGRTTVTFKLQTCDPAIIRFLPKTRAQGLTGYRFYLNRKNKKNGKTSLLGRICKVNSKQTFDCYEQEDAIMSSTCPDYKPFWIRFSESGQAEFGQGCVVGSRILFSHTDTDSFVLGQITLSSKYEAAWVFDDDGPCTDEDPLPTPPLGPTTISTNGDEKAVKVSSYGIDLSGKASVVFKLKTCDAAIIRLFPKSRNVGMTGFRIHLNRETWDKRAVYGTGRVCKVKSDKWFDCDYRYRSGTHKPMSSTCQEHKAFWIRFTESGKSEFGQGCEVGSRTMFSHKETKPFILGEAFLSSTKGAEWIFEDDATCHQDVSDVDKSDNTEPTHVTTRKDGNKTNGVDISKYGVDFSGKNLVKFQLKTCNKAIIRFFPRSMTTYSTGYKIHLQRRNNNTGNYFSTGRACYVNEDRHLNCYNKTHTGMKSACQQYRPFWFRILDGKKIEFGVGCKVGVDALFSHSATLPFVLGTIFVSSDEKSDWIFGSTTCEDQEEPDTTDTGVTEGEESSLQTGVDKDTEDEAGESTDYLQDEEGTSSKPTTDPDSDEEDESEEDQKAVVDDVTSVGDEALEVGTQDEDKEDTTETSNGGESVDGEDQTASVADDTSTDEDGQASSEADVTSGNEAANDKQSDAQTGTGEDGDGTEVEKEEKKMSLSSILGLDGYLDNGSSSIRLPHLGLLFLFVLHSALKILFFTT